MPEGKRKELLDGVLKQMDSNFFWLAGENPRLKSWLDTARAIATCEYVLTVDTAVAHLAGAMGKETHLLLGRWSDWKWGIGSDKTPWYPSMTIHRNWDLQKVLDRVSQSSLKVIA